jgi:hypothetical protein
MTHDLEHLESVIDDATTRLLIPLRMSKDLDLEAVQILLQCVDQLKDVLGTSPTIPRRLAGKLWFVFTQMLAEAGHTRAPEPILKAAWEYEYQLSLLFYDPFASNDPFIPGVPRY